MVIDTMKEKTKGGKRTRKI